MITLAAPLFTGGPPPDLLAFRYRIESDLLVPAENLESVPGGATALPLGAVIDLSCTVGDEDAVRTLACEVDDARLRTRPEATALQAELPGTTAALVTSRVRVRLARDGRFDDVQLQLWDGATGTTGALARRILGSAVGRLESRLPLAPAASSLSTVPPVPPDAWLARTAATDPPGPVDPVTGASIPKGTWARPVGGGWVVRNAQVRLLSAGASCAGDALVTGHPLPGVACLR